MHAFLMTVLRNQRGATAVEYGLILSLIALAIVGGLQGLGSGNYALWDHVLEKVTAALH